MNYLIAVSCAGHATHYTENVVVLDIYINYRARWNSTCIYIKGGIINARKVTCATRLVLLRIESE